MRHLKEATMIDINEEKGLLFILKSFFFLQKDYPNHIFFLRGQANKNWELKPSIFRGKNFPRKEVDLYNRFLIEIQTIDKSFPENIFDRLLYMQYYGLSTRLLDWTTNILIALFFIAEEEKNKDGRLFLLNSQYFNRPKNSEEGILYFLHNFDDYKNAEKDTHIYLIYYLFLEAFGKNQIEDKPLEEKRSFAISFQRKYLRQSLQQSYFTIHHNSVPLDDKDLLYLDISASVKSEILEQLNLLGINKNTIFRTPENLATNLKNKYENKE